MQSILSCRVVLLFLPAIVFIASGFSMPTEKPSDSQSLQDLLPGLKSRLHIPQDVDVAVVPAEERMVAVHRVRQAQADDRFTIQIDQKFFDSLSSEGLDAAIAHELGHVWIYSHHPYLHTEALANEIAMRVVSRESVKKLYLKLWAQLETTGDLNEVLGSD